ncbi:MAG: hypothetical protein IT371_28770 [Deltaproteobacteria bacterium]|nr:hypothetical protein [Deltaproteobacteria bacterium]
MRGRALLPTMLSAVLLLGAGRVQASSGSRAAEAFQQVLAGTSHAQASLKYARDVNGHWVTLELPGQKPITYHVIPQKDGGINIRVQGQKGKRWLFTGRGRFAAGHDGAPNGPSRALFTALRNLTAAAERGNHQSLTLNYQRDGEAAVLTMQGAKRASTWRLGKGGERLQAARPGAVKPVAAPPTALPALSQSLDKPPAASNSRVTVGSHRLGWSKLNVTLLHHTWSEDLQPGTQKPAKGARHMFGVRFQVGSRPSREFAVGAFGGKQPARIYAGNGMRHK